MLGAFAEIAGWPAEKAGGTKVPRIQICCELCSAVYGFAVIFVVLCVLHVAKDVLMINDL